MNEINLKMFYKCYSNLIDTFKVLYATQKAFNCMCSKVGGGGGGGGGGQLVITDKKTQEQTRSFLIKFTSKILFKKI